MKKKNLEHLRNGGQWRKFVNIYFQLLMVQQKYQHIPTQNKIIHNRSFL